MKKVLSILFACVAFASVNAQTQSAPTQQPTPQQQAEHLKRQRQDNQQRNTEGNKMIQQMPAAFACPKCFNISKPAGNCDKCNVAKVQLGSYYCLHCAKSTGIRPGDCPMCKAPTTQITRKYCAAHGGTPLRDFHNENHNGNGDHNKPRRDMNNQNQNVEPSHN